MYSSRERIYFHVFSRKTIKTEIKMEQNSSILCTSKDRMMIQSQISEAIFKKPFSRFLPIAAKSLWVPKAPFWPLLEK